jgi:hypothetical protein
MPREDIAGPTSLGIGLYNDKLINLAARITGRYCDLGENSCVDIDYKRGSGAERKFISRFSVSPAEENLLEALRI